MKKQNQRGGIRFDDPPQEQTEGRAHGDRKEWLLRQAALWAIGTLLLISLGGALLSLTGIRCFAPVNAVWAGVCMGLCLFFYRHPRFRPALICAVAAFVIVYTLVTFSLCRDGFAYALNGWKDLAGLTLSRVFLPSAVAGGHGEVLSVTVFLVPVTAVAAVIVSYMLLARGRAVVFFGLAALFAVLMLPKAAPLWPWYAGLFSGLALLFIVRDVALARKSGGGKSVPPVLAVVCLVAFALSALPALGILPGGYDRPGVLSKAAAGFENLSDGLRWGDDATNNLPEGRFDRLWPLQRSEKTALNVTMSRWESLYLRGYVGTVYTAKGWQETDLKTLYSYGDVFYWLHDADFYGTAQLSAVNRALGREIDPITVTVRNIAAKKKYVYTPYEYASPAVGVAASRIGDVAPDPRDMAAERKATYEILPNQVRTSVELANALDEAADDGDEAVLAYLRLENAYRDYVYATAMNIPKKLRPVLEEHFGEADLEDGHIDYDIAMQNILDEVWACVAYEEEAAGDGGDIVREALDQTGEGYSVHFATVAALAFRHYGIPARYVEGYIIAPEDIYGISDEETIAVTGENAHAWVEYYRDGVGWIPFEVTPPYLFVMEQPDQLHMPESNQLDAESRQEGMVNMDEENYEEEEEEEENLAKKKAKKALWLIFVAIFAGLLLLAFLGFLALLIRRRRIFAAGRKRLAAADEKQQVDILFQAALRVLFAAGIKEANVSLDDYVAPLKAAAGDSDIGALLSLMIDLHREVRFSDHVINASRVDLFRRFYDRTVAYAAKHVPFYRRFIHRYIQCIY